MLTVGMQILLLICLRRIRVLRYSRPDPVGLNTACQFGAGSAVMVGC